MCRQVFSSAKYPAPERLREYGSIFTGAQDPGLQRRPRHRIQSKHRPLDERALQVCGSALHPGGTEAPEDPDCWRSRGSLWPGAKTRLPQSIPISSYPQEKLKFFPVCVNTKPEPEDEAEEGLGGLPSNISSVSSLLLFNTTENL